MNSTANSKRMIGPRVALAVTTALAGTLLTSCSSEVAPPASASASRAEAARADGRRVQAIANAEAAVLAEPRNAAYRSMLASVYLDAGRFASAETAYKDAMQLGDNSPRNALSLSLALAAQAKYDEAAGLLNEWEGEIATADLGLALALAGQPERGIHLMGNAIRAGDNTPKMRQNLAFAYALAGRWREARLMAAQDVPGDQVSARIEQWAMMTTPEAWQYRVAALLHVPAGASDAGQPAQLALVNTPTVDELAAEADAEPLAVAPAAELPAVEASQPSAFQAAFASPPAAVNQDATQFVQAPVVQAVPARQSPTPRAAPRAAAPASVAPQANGTHLVQLGSFSSEQAARRAWSVYVRQYPELAGHQMVISEANVRGKHYWRVAASGFGKSSSSAMCGRVRAAGNGCIAYAQGRPLPGAVDTGTRLARR